MRKFTTFEALEAAAGEEIGVSDWTTITQEQVNTFAEATGDHQWIHVDVEKAKSGPFGTTIAHGYLTLSMIPGLSDSVMALETRGSTQLRRKQGALPQSSARWFTSSRDRLDQEVTDIPAGKQLTLGYVIEIDGQSKPACVAETVVLLLPI
ncbi:MAG: MaoC family dehydratase [Marmoricola sp.]